MHNLAIYIHWPFCISKCPYCDFNSYKTVKYNINEWINAYNRQLEYFKDCLKTQNIQNKHISSIFFGGGTPSLMEPKIIGEILNKIFTIFSCSKNIEISIETNPSNLEKKIFDFKTFGINRISLGVQSLNDKDLKFLGRSHNIKDVYNTLDQIFLHFDNISIDLIYALSTQSIKRWEKELVEFLKKYRLKHLSAYQLSLEQGTKFYDLHKKGLFDLASDDTCNDFYRLTRDILNYNKLFQYEISNFSKPSFQSKHNKIYWNSENWIGIGPGAVSRLWNHKGERIEVVNFKKPDTWLKYSLCHSTKFKKINFLDKKIAEKEILIMGLRLVEGIELNKFSDKALLKSREIQYLINNKVLSLNNNKIAISKSFFERHNYIVKKIIDNF